MALNLERHYEVVAFAYWLCARGYFDGQREVIRYFENPQEWAERHVWLVDLYESQAVPAL